MFLRASFLFSYSHRVYRFFSILNNVAVNIVFIVSVFSFLFGTGVRTHSLLRVRHVTVALLHFYFESGAPYVAQAGSKLD